MKINDKVLDAPCVFCEYDGSRYWNAHSHDKDCPFYRVIGKGSRRAAFKNAIRKQAILLNNLRKAATLVIKRRN